MARAVADLISDAEMTRLVDEVKRLPVDWKARMRPRAKVGHDEAQLEVTGDDGGEFVIALRQSQFNRSAFSVILMVRPPGALNMFRLRRYNGHGHEHPNKIEGNVVAGPHIHEATERYQLRGMKEDSYATATTRYSDLDGAVSCLIEDCGFVTEPPPTGDTMPLWPT